MEHKKHFKLLKVRADLPPVEVPDLLEDGRVPPDKLEADIDVFISFFDGLKKDDTLTLYVNTVSSGQTVTVTQTPDPAFKAAFTISKDNFPPPGGYFQVSLDYEYFDSALQESSRSGQPLTVIFDREPPGGASLRALHFTEDQLKQITEDDLIAGNLPVSAYAWFGMEVGDVITPWVSDAPPLPGTTAQYLLTDFEVTAQNPGSPVELLFPRKSFEGTGIRYFGYQLKDKLNNTSALSTVTEIPVDLAIKALQ